MSDGFRPMSDGERDALRRQQALDKALERMRTPEVREEHRKVREAAKKEHPPRHEPESANHH